ncbi:MAG: hypothetical protein ACP5KI_02270 [Brevinematia bacterium]
MKVVKILIFIVFYLLLFLTYTFAKFDPWNFKFSVGEIFKTDLERKFFYEYKSKGEIPDFEVWLLMASGVYSPEDIKLYKSKIDSISSDISNKISGKKISRYDLAKFIFEYLHQNILKEYLEKATDLDALFDTGYYNCVNSTAIYNILLERFGFKPKAIQLPDHIFTIIYLDDYPIEVETTARKGFDVVRNPDAIKELKDRTPYIYVPSSKGKRVEVDDEGVIATMYVNQVLVFKDIKRYDEILKSSAKGLILEPNLSIAYTNLRSAYIGIFSDYADKDDWGNAILFAKEALSIFENDKEIDNFIGSAYYNYILTLINKGNFKDAIEKFNYVKDKDTRYYGEIKSLLDYLLFNWGKSEISKGNYQIIFDVVNFGLKFDRNLTYKAGVNLLLDLSKVFSSRDDYESIINFHKKFIEIFPEGNEVKQNLGYFYNVWGVELMNKGQLDKSAQVFENALTDLPNDEVLKQNASIVYAKLTQISFSKRDYEKAIYFINRAIELNSSKQLTEIRKNIYIDWVKFLTFSEENYTKAKKVCEEALSFYPEDENLNKIYKYVLNKLK